MDARSEILGLIAGAVVAPAPAERATVTSSIRTRPEVVEQFAEYAADYKANVFRCSPGEVKETISGLLAGTVVVPADFPADWLPEGPIFLPDANLAIAELDKADAVLTLCATAIAETGTFVLDHGEGQGRRAITLVPDHHVVIVSEHQIVDSVPEAVADLAGAVRAGRPLTWISGPSATSDIELSRVEGVHGPRRLDIVIVGGGAA